MVELQAPGTYSEWFGNLFRAFPDFRFEILELVAEGEKAAVRWRATGTFNGDTRFEGMDPTGAKVDITGFDLLTIRNGRLQHNDAYMNGAQMAQQLGALPPPAPCRRKRCSPRSTCAPASPTACAAPETGRADIVSVVSVTWRGLQLGAVALAVISLLALPALSASKSRTGSDPSTWRLKPTGIGPLRLGMSVSKARSIVPGLRVRHSRFCDTWIVQGLDDVSMFATHSRGGLSGVSISGFAEPAPYGHGARGVEVNDSMHELRQAFGKRLKFVKNFRYLRQAFYRVYPRPGGRRTAMSSRSTRAPRKSNSSKPASAASSTTPTASSSAHRNTASRAA